MNRSTVVEPGGSLPADGRISTVSPGREITQAEATTVRAKVVERRLRPSQRARLRRVGQPAGSAA